MKGFTLIELLVAIAICGLLAGIAVPSYLSYPQRARESEAQLRIRAGIEAQQAHYLEFQDFAPNFQNLDLGASFTNNYSYFVTPLEAPGLNEATAIIANPVKAKDKAFLGGIETVVNRKGIRFSSAICESSTPIKKIQKLLEIRTRRLKCKGEL